nr:hypothetical protein [Tanacetum cinerariifolium]
MEDVLGCPVFIRVSRENNMYNVDLKHVVPSGVVVGYQPNDNADPKNINDDVADDAFEVKENENDVHVSTNESDKTDKEKHDEKAKRDDKGKIHVDSIKGVRDLRVEFEEFSFNSTNRVNAVSEPVNAAKPNLTNSTNSFNTASPSVNDVSPNFGIVGKSLFVDPSKYHDDPDMPELEDIIYSDDEEDIGAKANLSNLETNIPVSSILTTKVHKDHPVNQIIGDLNSAPQTRSMTRMVKEQEPKKVLQALKDPSWIEAMQEKLLQFKLQKVWVLVDLPKGKRAIEEGIDYDEVFAPVARIEAIRLFLAYASFMGFMVYQMDVKSVFLYETIKEEVYVCQYLGFEDHDYPDKVYKVVKALFGLHQAPRAWYLKGKPHLGLWYHRDSPFNLVAYSDSDYAGASLDRKSITGDGIRVTAGDLQLMLLGHKLMLSRTDEEEVVMDAESQGRKNLNAASKEVSAVIAPELVNTAEPTVFDDEDKLHDEEVQKVAARDEQEKADMEKALELQRELDEREDDINWSVVIEQVKERHAKRTAWNKFSSSMASDVICLATGRKFNFSKYIFDNMVKDVDSPSNFLMYLRFIQFLLDHQVDDMVPHNTRYKSPVLTQKVFANLRRVGKGFSSVVTPLFDSMLVQSQQQAKACVEVPITHAQPSKTSAPLPTEHQDTTPIPHDTPPQYQPPTPQDSPLQDQLTTPHDSPMPLLTTLMETCATLSQKVEKAIILDEKIAQKLHDEEVQKVTGRDEQERADMEKALELQRQLDEREDDIDWSVVAKQVKERQTDSIKRYQDLKKKPVSVAQARKNMMIYIKNMNGYKIDFFKGMTYDEIRAIFEREEDLVALWNLVKERFSLVEPIEDNERALWVELKRLFKLDANDVPWKLQRYMHAPLTWRLYSDCGVHHVSVTRGYDIYMLIEKDYPLSNAVMILMLSGKLQAEEDNEMA